MAHIPMTEVQSSNIAGIGYDKKAKILQIQFNTGRTYHYFPVEPMMHRELIDASSIGGYFHENIKNNPSIHFEKIS